MTPLEMEHQLQEVISIREASCFSVENQSGAFGSGVMLSASGLLLTAAHVAGHSGDIVTIRAANLPPLPGRVLCISQEHDLALVSTLTGMSSRTFSYVPMADWSGETNQILAVVALGHASGFREGRPAPARLGYLTRNGGTQSLFSTCRLTAGDSGGPLFDLAGRLIGIHRAVDPVGGYALHTPIHLVLSQWSEFFERERQVEGALLPQETGKDESGGPFFTNFKQLRFPNRTPRGPVSATLTSSQPDFSSPPFP